MPPAVTTCSAETVAAGLADETTRSDTLDALEGRRREHDSEIALRAAPALVDIIAKLTSTEQPGQWPETVQRTAVVLFKLIDDAPLGDEYVAVFGAAWGEGRLFDTMQAVQARLDQPGYTLTLADASCYAYIISAGLANHRMYCRPRLWKATSAAAGKTELDYMKLFKICFALQQQQQMAALLLQLVRDRHFPEGTASGAWMVLGWGAQGDPADILANSDIFSLGAARLSDIGTPADCLVRPRISPRHSTTGAR